MLGLIGSCCALALLAMRSRPRVIMPHRDAITDWSTLSRNGETIHARRNESLIARIRADHRERQLLAEPRAFRHLGHQEWS